VLLERDVGQVVMGWPWVSGSQTNEVAALLHWNGLRALL